MKIGEIGEQIDLKRILPVLAASLCIWIAFLAMDSLKSLERKKSSAEAALAAMRVEAQELLDLEKRLNGYKRQIDGSDPGLKPVPLLEELVSRLGLSSQVKNLKSTDSRQDNGFIFLSAELELERLDLNQLVNLLFRIKNHNALLIVKRAEVEQDFQESDRLNLAITVSLVKAAPG